MVEFWSTFSQRTRNFFHLFILYNNYSFTTGIKYAKKLNPKSAKILTRDKSVTVRYSYLQVFFIGLAEKFF